MARSLSRRRPADSRNRTPSGDGVRSRPAPPPPPCNGLRSFGATDGEEAPPLPSTAIGKDAHLPVELALLVLLSLLWGGSFTLIKIAVETVPPATIAAVRVTVAGALLFAVAVWRGLPVPADPATWRALFVQGLLQSALPFTLIGWGERYVDSGLAGVLNATTPVLLLLITAVFTRHEPIGWQRTLGVLLGMLGVVIILGPGTLPGAGAEPLAQLAILGASLSYALAALWGRRFAGLPSTVTAMGAMLCAAAVMTPVAIVGDRPWLLSPGPRAIAALALLSVFSTAIAMMIYFRLLRTLGALGTTGGSYLRAGASVMLGVIVLGESVTWSLALGMGLILAGVAGVNDQLRPPGQRRQARRFGRQSRI